MGRDGVGEGEAQGALMECLDVSAGRGRAAYPCGPNLDDEADFVRDGVDEFLAHHRHDEGEDGAHDGASEPHWAFERQELHLCGWVGGRCAWM